MQKTIVVFEDMRELYLQYTKIAEEYGVECIICTNINEVTQDFLQRHFADETPLVVIVDGRILGSSEEPNTIPIVRAIREIGYNGLMIAGSQNERFNRILMRAGCDEELEIKSDGLRRVEKILSQSTS